MAKKISFWKTSVSLTELCPALVNCTEPNCTILYSAALRHCVFYCTVLNCTVLHYTKKSSFLELQKSNLLDFFRFKIFFKVLKTPVHIYFGINSPAHIYVRIYWSVHIYFRIYWPVHIYFRIQVGQHAEPTSYCTQNNW